MKDRVRILHVIKSLGRGGAEMLLPETLKLHDTSKFSFHYVYFLPWKDQMVQTIQEGGGQVTCFSARNNLSILLRYWRLAAYIREHSIDVVHCHLPWAGFLGRLIFRFTGMPVIYTEHNKQERYHRITYFLNKHTFNWQSVAVAVSDEVQTSIRTHIAPKVDICTIRNGVNTDTFVRDIISGNKIRDSLRIPAGALVFGNIAVFRFQKRLVEWLDVAACIVRANPNAYFLLVGDGPEKDRILKRRSELGLESRVLMPGLQTDVKPWLSAMDIFMITSIFEGLPVALLEAMSMECAVLTTTAGGIGEVIRNGVDGLSVDVGQYTELAELAVEMRNDAYRLKLAKQARQRVKQAFSLQRMVSQLEDMYLEVANKH